MPAPAFSEIYEHYPFDGGAPPNDSPLEGIADVDGDGIANFLDNDDDGDGSSTQPSRPAGINLRTPLIDSVSPTAAVSFATTTGHRLRPGLRERAVRPVRQPDVRTAGCHADELPARGGAAGRRQRDRDGDARERREPQPPLLNGFFRFASGLSHTLTSPPGARLGLDLSSGALPVVTGLGKYATNFDIDGVFEGR